MNLRDYLEQVELLRLAAEELLRENQRLRAMKIVEIEVVASMTFPSRVVPYANVKPEARVRAHIAEGEDLAASVAQLQTAANAYCCQHAEQLLKLLEGR